MNCFYHPLFSSFFPFLMAALFSTPLIDIDYLLIITNRASLNDHLKKETKDRGVYLSLQPAYIYRCLRARLAS